MKEERVKSMNIRNQIKLRIGSLALPLVLFIVWQFIASQGYILAMILPSPATVFNTLITNITQHDLLLHVAASLKRVIVGFLVGTVSGFALGLFMGLSRTAEKIFAPTFHVIRQVPVIGWIPLIVMWFAIAEVPQIIIISLAAFYPMTLNTFAGVRNVRKEYLELASVNGYKGIKLIRKIIVPSALPSIITGATLSLGMSWGIMMAAEFFIDTSYGIGTRIQAGRSSFNMALVLVGIFTIGLIGYVLTVIIETLGRVVNQGRDVNKEI
ncbi:MAG TPA: ABC transporter permease [Chlorobaculum sp.]|nr:ABC transporter permease [Chlorobaculum sp.]